MADNSGEPKDKKVDEDWKKKAQDEKSGIEGGGTIIGGGKPEAAEAPEAEAGGEDFEIPPASFAGLVSGLAAQGYIFLGLMENPVSGAVEKNLDAARHVIDTLAMLIEKTKGNLTEAEKAYIENLTYGLQMQFVEASK